MKRKFIPKKIYQATVLCVILLCLFLAAISAFASREPFSFFQETVFRDKGPDIAVISFLMTFLLIFICSLPLLILLRIFSDMPAFKEGLKKDPLFSSSVADYSGNYDIPSPWLRIFAFIIDRTLSIVLVVAGIPLFIFSESSGSGNIKVFSLLLFFSLLTAAVFYSYARDAFKGKSLGRKLLKMRVVDEKTGKPIKFWKSFLREIGLHIAPLLAIELVFIFKKPDGRRIGDLWAKSIVVKDFIDRQSDSRLSS